MCEMCLYPNVFNLNNFITDSDHYGYGSLHSSVTSQPKAIGQFTAHPKQIEFDFCHATAYYLLVGVCCPRGFDLCCEFGFFYRSISDKNCDVGGN